MKKSIANYGARIAISIFIFISGLTGARLVLAETTLADLLEMPQVYPDCNNSVADNDATMCDPKVQGKECRVGKPPKTKHCYRTYNDANGNKKKEANEAWNGCGCVDTNPEAVITPGSPSGPNTGGGSEHK